MLTVYVLLGVGLMLVMVTGIIWVMWSVFGPKQQPPEPPVSIGTVEEVGTTEEEVDTGTAVEDSPTAWVIEAWVGKDDTRLQWTDPVPNTVKLYRSRDEDCDITNVTQCTEGAVDTIVTGPNTLMDTALNLTTPAYYQAQVGTYDARLLVGPPMDANITRSATVVFKNHIWHMGGADLNGDRTDAVWYSDGHTRTQATAHAAFSPRYYHACVVFQNKLWIIGGDDGTLKNDVWSSSDGITWTETMTGPTFTPRKGHTSAVFQGKMWVIGGDDGSPKNDVWSSSDGITWTVTVEPPFSGRRYHTSVVFQNHLWVIGGDDGTDYKNDIWYSLNGQTWTEAGTTGDKFSERKGHSSVVYHDMVWVIGGESYDELSDVWSSPDGHTWKRVTDTAEFSARFDHSTVVYDGKIWVLNGTYISYTDVYEQWYSTDGVTWTLTGLPSLTSHAGVVFQEKMWVVGGNVIAASNKVWSSDDGITWTAVPDIGDRFTPRGYHTCVAFQEKMWVIAGEQVQVKNDVWSSSDGQTWTEEKAIGDTFVARGKHQCVVFQGKMWVIAGMSAFPKGLNDVWSSSDGRTWTEEQKHDRDQAMLGVTFHGRYDHACVVFQEKMWIIGGYVWDEGEWEYRRENDVWSSSDGQTWTKVTTIGPIFSSRRKHTCVVFQDKMWVIGGESSLGELNDVWSSSDGIAWEEESEEIPFEPRSYHSSVVSAGSMWIIAGDYKSDVWSLSDSWRRGRYVEFFK